ncbi:uncharacterized protein G2W53_020393 [Senna tora]|uniref:Uncharacterized protein n=1 Tax=Senna tora TaxID=362788 RepID=A0A834U345_9FABA|nr:uncharacterized protein G2W53_020393 [Senna tora]
MMENKQTVTAAGIQDNPTMKPINQRARTKGRNDIMTQRLKNRERQRRYRARKRLEAEIKKSSVVRDTTPQEEPQSNGSHDNFMSRVYCNRDWKKDARRAHALKRQEMTANGSINHYAKLTNEPEAGCLASGNKAEPMQEREMQSGSPGVVNSETPRIVLSRRDWKAEARKKKN